MKKTFKRVLSLLMALVLVCSVLPVSHVHAEGEVTVTFSINGATQTLTGSAGEAMTPPEVEDPEGFTFIGWVDAALAEKTTEEPSLTSVETFPAESTTLYALYSKLEASVSNSYVKVTVAPTDWSGNYLIVCEGESLAFNGSLTTLDAVSNYVEVTIADNAIAANDDLKDSVFVIAAIDGGYSIQSASGSYIGQTSDSNGLKSNTTAYTNTLSLNDDGSVNIVSGGAYLRYNATSGQTRFRYYKSSTYTSQKAIALYRETEVASDTTFYVTSLCDHANAYAVEEIPATCTAGGYTAGEFCPDCNTYLSGHEVIEALGHSLDEGVITTEAACTTAGVKTYTCTREDCGYTETEAIPATGHSYADGVCSVCGQKAPQYIKTELSELSAEDTVIIVSTNSDNASYAMSNDKAASAAPTAVSVTITDDTITTEATNILWNISADADGNLTIYPAGETATWLYCTATNNGVRVGTNANSIFTIDAESGYLKNSATSRFLGVYNGQDWRCYTSYTTANIANQTFSFYKQTCQHADTAEVEAIAATCTEDGHAAGTICTICGAYITGGEVIEALGHSWNDGEITKEPTCTVNGTKTYICATCGTTKTETIAATGHTFDVIDDNYVCSVCGHSEPTAETLTIAEAIELGTSLAIYTSHKYSVTGVVTEVYNTQYGNMYITDGNGNTLQIYGTYSADGTVRYDAMDVKPAAGDTVTVYGVIGQFNGTAQMKNVWLMEHVVKPVDQWNITLGDDLNVNFYLNLNEGDQVQVTVGDEAVTYNAADLQTTEDGKYIVTVEMAAAQMMDEITIWIVDSIAAPETYTIRQYADTVLADETKSDYHALVKEMLNYGAMAQVYFDHNAANLANADIEGFGTDEVTGATYETTIYEGAVDGIRFYSASLVYGSKVAVRLYFQVLSGSIEDYTFSTVLPDAENGIEADNLTPVAKGDYYYIEFADISPDKWDEVVNLYVIKGEQNIHVQYSPLSYMVRMSNKAASSDALKNLLNAMYNYHLAAKNLVVAE